MGYPRRDYKQSYVGLKVRADLDAQLKVLAAAEHCSKSEMVRRLIVLGLQAKEPEENSA
jgi:hypothetical protein